MADMLLMANKLDHTDHILNIESGKKSSSSPSWSNGYTKKPRTRDDDTCPSELPNDHHKILESRNEMMVF